MKRPKLRSSLLLILLAGTFTNSLAQVAQTPPMGWNSYDSYGATVTEQEIRANAKMMATHLKHAGWEYVVVDYCWYYPNVAALNNPPQTDDDYQPRLIMDEYSRLLPDPERFPSANSGKGFKPLADYIHSLGLKFGIHVMRGIPRQAVYLNSKIKGLDISARELADTKDSCQWLDNMYGIDWSKKGGQEYYNSLIELYASWGVDYIKVDDILAIGPYHENDIEALRKAIDLSGRDMVLSLSPGAAPLDQAAHLKENVNLWRISADFWDRWEDLKHQFDLCHQWEQHIEPGHWPDADMIPIGLLSQRGPLGPERRSNYSADEQQTLMTLWSIARSPLMYGGDLTMMRPSELHLLTNKEVLAVNQASENNRQLFRRGNHVAWIADVPNSENKYLGVFNLGEDAETPVYVLLADMGISASVEIKDLWSHKNLGKFKKDFQALLPAHGSGLYLIKTN